MSATDSLLRLPEAPKSEPEKMLLRGRHGFFMVMPSDLIVGMGMMIYGEHNEHEWQFVKRFIRHGQTIVDAGGNFGTFTVPFAHAVGVKGKVITFEPQPQIFDCLKTTVAMNKFVNVELHNACLGSRAESLTILEPDYAAPGNYGGLPFKESQYDELVFSEKKITVPCQTLDAVLAGRKIDFLKMDVEGMELDVLEGGVEAIGRDHPVVYAENNRPAKSPALIKCLADHGYKMWWHTGAFFNPHNFAGYKDNIYGKRHNVNMIALHDPAHMALIPKSLRPVVDENDHIIDADGKITPSFADDVTGG